MGESLSITALPTRRELEREKRHNSEMKTLRENRKLEQQRRNAQRRLEREEIRQNNRNLRSGAASSSNTSRKRIEMRKYSVKDGISDIELVDGQSRRYTFHGPVAGWFLKKDGCRDATMLKIEYETTGFVLEDINLGYKESSGDITINFFQDFRVCLTCPTVDLKRNTSMEISPEGRLTFSIPLTGTKDLPEYDVHCEKSRPLGLFESLNDVD